MTDAAQEAKAKAPVTTAIGQAIDKLTDPIELAIRKIFSARFLISVSATFFLYKLSVAILAKYPDAAQTIFAVWATGWSTIVGCYFGASMNTPIEGPAKK